MKARRRVVPDISERFWLILALLVVVLIAVLSYRGWAAFDRQNREIKDAQRMLDVTNGLLNALLDAETGQRGYLLTGRDRYLDPYRRAIDMIPAYESSLAQAVRSAPDQATRVEALKPLIRSKLAELQDTIDLRARSGLDAGLAVVLTDRGKLAMDQIRRLCQEIQSVAYDHLVQASAQASSSANEIGFAATAGGTGLFALLLVSAVVIRAATARREELIDGLWRTEEQTRIARDWLQTTVRSIGDGVIATGPEGEVVLLNSVAESLTGWKQDEAAGLPLERVFSITNEDTGLPAENPVTKVLREGRVVGLANHTNLKSKDGRLLPIDDSAAPIRDASGKIAGVVLVFRDVSDRRAAERKERQAAIESAGLAAIVESSDDAIISTDLNGVVTSWNPAAARIFGYSREEMLGQQLSMLAPPGRADEMPRMLEKIAQGERISHYETIRRTKAGKDIHISLTISPVRDGSGVVAGASKISRDITDRIEAEQERRRQTELIARSNADLQRFAYAASHDLREPLRTIVVYGQLLERNLRDRLDPRSAEILAAIAGASKRMTRLIDALLEYSKAAEANRPGEEIETGNALAIALANLKEAIESDQATITHDPLPRLLGAEVHFIQIFQNIIGNALKYRRDDPPVVHISARRQGDRWEFSIRDNGQGIPPEFHEQVFELFKRLHGQDQSGSGIGLATCKKIVEHYGGRIWVDSEPGAGSTFFFTVPATGPSKD